MALELLKDKWTNAINAVKLGATKAEGGTRSTSIMVGGETTMPFLLDDGRMPHKPVVAMERVTGRQGPLLFKRNPKKAKLSKDFCFGSSAMLISSEPAFFRHLFTKGVALS